MNRIDILASLCKGSNIICDVGCDHGYVVVNALKYHGVNRALACDVAADPLNSARVNVINNNLDDRVKFILSDGLKNVNEDFDTLIIAGMGGNLIENILNNSMDKLNGKKLIIEPNNHRELVRRILANNGFVITDEIALFDKNHYYEIMIFENGKANYTDFEINYGPILLKKKPKEFIDFYSKSYERLLKIQSNISNQEKLNENQLLIDDYKRILEG